jgi:hypothetical protein
MYFVLSMKTLVRKADDDTYVWAKNGSQYWKIHTGPKIKKETSTNNNEHEQTWQTNVVRIYSIELEIKDTTDTDKSASYLDLLLEIDSEGQLRTKLYDKRDDFNFAIVNFPFMCSNIPTALAYWVYISQMIRYPRGCSSYQDFLDRGLLLTRKLLIQGFLLVKLNSSLRKLYCRHHDMVDRYGISVSQMTTDMFHLS